MVDTGQNYDPTLRDVFFKDLIIRKPNYRLGATGTFGEQLGKMMPSLETIILKEKPDAVLVLGDTNSSLGAILAKRMGIRVFHMEAGNRCFDDRVPEEVNRRLIDHASDILMPYTERSRQNLLDEGIESQRIYVTGNPIKEVLDHFESQIAASDIMDNLELEPGKFFVATLHRHENLSDPGRVRSFVTAFNEIVREYGMPLVWSCHPRTQKHLENWAFRDDVIAVNALGLFDFVKLERNAYCVLTDSGTVQEECAIFGKPVVTLRDSTERPETIEAGSNFIASCKPKDIFRGINTVINAPESRIPPEYNVRNVSDTVVKIVLSHWS